ncbi:hypothetical protein CFC21_040062 [Triticum aestivum]|uniref:Rx N-terminal domain-containing protein n=3 Tax=Triticum TaxID=4564 RepID=A0A9R1FGD1_WHEAT|nr:uncharacterized protein LOC119274972 [Triticum dicoccoides]KAF7028094.1 hypothetical protein CFC21_040062 [Triticum aestivum]CDM81466.1 unnamed protein product [Triticum aestivum]VAH73128.1 unnamed protein product [Triticum turgidum subsp. durum]
MKILESPLMGEFIGYLKSNWGGNSRVSQRRRRLRQLVAMVRGVADAAEARAAVRGSSLHRWLQLLRKEALRGQQVLDATTDPSAVVGSAKKFLAGLKSLFVCSAEVDRLTDAVDALERLAGPGADLDIFLKVLQLDVDMDVDDAAAAPAPAAPFSAAHYVDQGSYSVATAPGAKRKRAGSSSVDQAGDADGDADGETAPHSHGRGVLDRAYRHKRRALACKRHTGFFPPPAGPDRSVAVAMAMARVRRRIGTPSLGQPFSRISLE